MLVLRFMTDNWECGKNDTASQVYDLGRGGKTDYCGLVDRAWNSFTLGDCSKRDSASVNDVAVRTVKVLYNQLVDIAMVFLPYTIDHVEKMSTPLLDDFVKAWVGLFSRSPS